MADARAPTPLVVIGGYLGAGKTTLVNHLLRRADGRRLAVLVNDFGELSIDADLIVGASDGVLALAGGCVCCSFGSDLLGSLVAVAARDPAPDLILLECSGVGLPAAVARSAALAPGVSVQGVVVLAEASQIRRQHADPYVGDTVAQQLQQADLLVVNQADTLDTAALSALQTWLAQQAPDVPQLACTFGQVPVDLLLDFQSPSPVPDESTRSSDAWQGSGGRYLRPWQADFQAEHAASKFRYHTEQFDRPVDLQALTERLSSSDTTLLRAKGVVQGLDGQAWLVQAVGRRVQVSVLTGRAAPMPSRLACISLVAHEP